MNSHSNALSRSCRLLSTAVCLFAVVGCVGYDDSDNNSDVSPYWEISYDTQTRAVAAQARVYHGLTDNTAGSYYPALRLTTNDILYLGYNEQRMQLYRRNVEYMYERMFVLPDEVSTLQVRLERANPAYASLLTEINIPDLASFELTEDAQEVVDPAVLNFSWELDSTVYDVSEQSLSIELERCTDRSSQSEVNNFLGLQTTSMQVLEPTARSASLASSELPVPSAQSNLSCDYSFKLRVKTTRVDERGVPEDGFVHDVTSVTLTTVSDARRSSVEFN